jgi:hypothetical protein
MFLLNQFLSKPWFHLLIIQLIVLSLLLLESILGLPTTLNIYTVMPVTTRSQTKASRNTFLYTGSSTSSLSSSAVPPEVTSHVYALDSSSSSLLSYSAIVNDQLPLLSPTPEVTPPLSSSLDFQIYPVHFEISNLSTVDTESPQSGTKFSCHNSSNSNLVKMEEECEKKVDISADGLSSSVNIEKLFTSFTNQIAYQIIVQTNSLRDEFRENEIYMVQDNEEFQIEMRDKLAALRNLLQAQTVPQASQSPTIPVTTSSVGSVSPSSPVTSPQPMLSSSTVVSQGSSSNSAGPPAQGDLQSQMMFMMVQSFSKLSTVLSESKQESKSEWPKFAGEQKKFRDWYLSIMTQLSLSPWNEFYDSVSNDVISTTTNSTLNGKLYSKLILSLEGKALKHAVSRKHLRANGLLLLSELVKTYKPTNVPEVIAAKTVEFWGHTKRLPTETIDQYYDRFHELLDDLQDADEPVTTKSAIRQFIFTLGSEFEPIQNNFRVKVLPSEWYSEDWPTILTLCRDYYNSVKLQGLMRRDHVTDTSVDCKDIRRKSRTGG